MESLKKQFDILDVRGAVVRSLNIIVLLIGFVTLLLLSISWGLSIGFEGGIVKRRHIGSIISFCVCFVTFVFDIGTLYMKPYKLTFFILQALTMLSMFLTAVSTGMACIVVDLCVAGEPPSANVHCSAHYMEYISGLFLILALGILFATVQQRLTMLEEHGVLQGFGNRMAQ